MMEFDFPLLSDPDRAVAAMMGAKRGATHPLSFLPRRITHLINPEGVISRAYNVGRNIEGHADEVLADIAELDGS